ncbi:MAG TPA: YidC/Oxa1 family membrane protein insertase [Ardenticatenaceae bacterium]|jgi:YidC/Oxa1 family membrane protein insertase
MWNSFVGLIYSSLEAIHTVLGSWGLAIILFTVAIKILTWPLTTKQVKSSKAMQELQPRMKELQAKYKDDKDAQTRETMKLYQELGINPLSGCLPMVIQMPIWFGLYQAISRLGTNDELREGFLFIPSLALPNAEMGLGWLTDFANLGTNWAYLVLPVLTVITQIAVSKLMTPTTPTTQNSDDPTQAVMKQMNTIMPVMFGFFALQFPAGLALYWVTNNVLTYIQYFVLNRAGATAPMTLAAVGAGDAPVVIESQATIKETPVRLEDGKPRRRRKKR